MIALSKNSIIYTIQNILRITFGYETDIILNKLSAESCEVQVQGIHIVFSLCDSDELNKLIIGNSKLQHIPSFDSFYEIPVLNPKENADFFTIHDNKIFIHYDIVSLPFLLLSSYDEWIAQNKDEFDRFMYKDSYTHKYGIIRKPLVDEYAFWLRKIFNVHCPGFSPKEKKFSIIPTHDIDDLYRFTNPVKSIKSLFGEIITQRNMTQFLDSAWSMIERIFSKSKDPYFRGIERLFEDSQKQGLQSVFFFMGAKTSKYDAGQIIDENVRGLINRIKESQMFCGIHPGFFTYKNVDLLGQEINKVNEGIGETVTKSRQHYLRFDIRETFLNLEKCGIKEDYTMGFAEEEGFRCGTSHPFHPYNVELDRAYTIIERPLIAMDVTLRVYKKYNLEKARKSLKELACLIRRVNGDFIILWHNAYVYRDFKWYNEVYLHTLRDEQR